MRDKLKIYSLILSLTSVSFNSYGKSVSVSFPSSPILGSRLNDIPGASLSVYKQIFGSANTVAIYLSIAILLPPPKALWGGTVLKDSITSP